MRRQRRMEAKRARRQARLQAETPERRQEREERRAKSMNAGAKRLGAALNFPKGHGAAKPKQPERFKLVPCTCEFTDHGVHEVRDRERERQEAP